MTNAELREILLQYPDDAEVYAYDWKGQFDEVEDASDIQYLDEDNSINIKWR